MTSLTSQQEVRLNELVAELETLPTPELILETVRIRSVDLHTEEGRIRYRQAMTGAIAAQKLMSYLVALRDVDDRRLSLGQEIHDLLSSPKPISSDQIQDYAHDQVAAFHLRGAQEVTFHFFCNCVRHLKMLLDLAASAAGLQVPEEDSTFLGEYNDLRNFFEHIDNRLPGRVNASEYIKEAIDEAEWTISAGLEVDDQGRILHKGKAIDVTTRGLARIEEIVKRNWDALRPAAIRGVRCHFEANPENIPSRESVRQDVFARDRKVP